MKLGKSFFKMVHLVFFISNAGKMRLVWSFTIFRVVAYFRCLEKIANIVVAQKKMLKNRINQKNSEKSRKIPENVANFFEKSLVRCLDFPKISTSLKIVAYKPLLIKKTKCTYYCHVHFDISRKSSKAHSSSINHNITYSMHYRTGNFE